MPVVAISNQKGGVGKTTSTVNLGAVLREMGKRVLLVDLDPQGNLSVATGIRDIDEAYPSIGDLLMVAARGKPARGLSIAEAIVRTPSGLDVVPSNGALSAAELGLVSAMNREAALANTLKPVRDQYDYILIDCLPSLGLLAINALRAADGVVIPVQADFLAMQGLAQIMETVAAVREQLNPDLAIFGVLLTMVDPRTSHAREVVNTIRQTLEGQVRVFDAEVRLHVVLKETAKAGRTILDFDSNSPSAETYRAVGRELLRIVGDTPSVTAPGEPVAASWYPPAPTPEPPSAAPGDNPATVADIAASVPTASEAQVPDSVDRRAAEAESIAPVAVIREGNGVASAPVVATAPPVHALTFDRFLEGCEQWLGRTSR